MEKDSKTKEGVFEQTIMKNIRRKSRYIDHVQMVDGVPLFSWIDINPTELCSRKCEFCPRRDPAEYPNQNLHMDVALAKKIADELRILKFHGGVIFSGHGEPLLHNDIVSLVRMFGSDIHTELVTCGDRLSVELVKELFAAGLGVILVSMYDGPHQVDRFKGVFEEVGLSSEQYVLRDRWYSIEEDYGVKLTNRGGTVTEGHQAAFEEKRPCYYTHYSLQIDWNGDVLLCVQDFNKKIKFGNLYAQSLLDIWKSGNISRYRKILGKGQRVMYPCDRCNVNGTLHGREHLEAWGSIYYGKRSE